MAVLPALSSETRVTADDAQHDKIELTIRHRILFGDDEDIESFRNSLGVAPSYLRAEPSASEFGRLFNRPPSSAFLPMPIRSSPRGGGADYPLPLFTGDYCFISHRRSQAWLTKLRLFLNPSRFLHHHTANTAFLEGASLQRSAPLQIGGEFSLNEDDNWVPDTPSFRAAQRDFATRAVERYMADVLRSVDDEVDRAAATALVETETPALSDRFNVDVVETYFEFAVNDEPLREVALIEQGLRGYNEFPLRHRDYPPPLRSGWDGVGICRVLSISLRSGVTLRVYAKTNRRLRFEVVHDMRKARLRDASGSMVRKTFPTERGVIQLLAALRADAAAAINGVVTHLLQRVALPLTSKTALDLIVDFTTAVGSRDLALTLLRVLMERGSITSTRAYGRELAKLRRAGVLQSRTTNHRREHVVTPAYQHPLLILQERRAFLDLIVRPRSRNDRRGLG